MKKLLSMVLVVVMMLALGMTASASNVDKGSITITNATADVTYTIYRIFDAKIKTAGGGVTYTIEKDSQFFQILFGADGTANNTYFSYNSATGEVKKKEGVNDTELTNYLSKLVRSGAYTAATSPIKAVANSGSKKEIEVVFSDIPYGYYVIDSDKGSVVTIDSNTPDVEVIDKNQTPGNNFDKQIYLGKDDENKDVYGNSNSASIGDMVEYKVSFDATNYDGSERIEYYSLHDVKGDAIWVEFNSFEVYVNGAKLDKGYYLCYGDSDLNTQEWDYFGTWTDEEKKNPSNADWYLVHLGYDEFRISIPWLTNHTLVENKDTVTGKVVSHSIDYDYKNKVIESKFPSPSKVEVKYTAAVEPNAEIGGTSDGNLYNKAYASWTTEHGNGSTPEDKVVTKVYGIAVEKLDSSTRAHLAGAKFRLYGTADHSNPINVIPTDIKGVYILDSLNTPGASVTGKKKDTARDIYKAYLADYLGADYETTKKQDNLLETPANGRIIVLGLEAGKYYLEEVQAPAGYNAMTGFTEVEAGTGVAPFEIYVKDKVATEMRDVADLKGSDETYKEKIYQVTSVDVENSTGLELPSTGGTGRTIIFTAGTVLAMVFAVLLITHKKMSIYTD